MAPLLTLQDAPLQAKWHPRSLSAIRNKDCMSVQMIVLFNLSIMLFRS